MTKAAAIYTFWSSFGLTAYEENAVPTGEDAPDFPYITYELITDDLGESAAMTASLWYRSSLWIDANAKSDEIGRYIGYGGVLLPCDGGRIWIQRGLPFSQSMGDTGDSLIRRKIVNITAMFLTNL